METMPAAETPKIVRAALWANIALMILALVGPRVVPGADAAALLFAVPMALILVIGVAAAIRAYILARRQDRPVRWTAFLPLSTFIVGVAATLILVYSDITWLKPAVEITPPEQQYKPKQK
jgi:membrane-anchored protein YejM (alkaline phosphatase superfamily)